MQIYYTIHWFNLTQIFLRRNIFSIQSMILKFVIYVILKEKADFLLASRNQVYEI